MLINIVFNSVFEYDVFKIYELGQYFRTFIRMFHGMVVRMYGIDGFGSPHPDIPTTCVVSETQTC